MLREPAVAGRFYPADPVELEHEVRRYLDAARSEVDGDPVGLICPHAGYVFSGPVAAESYRTLRGRRYDAVVIISPSHFERFHEVAVLTEGAYLTPLGEVPVHTRLAERMVSSGGLVRAAEAGHRSGPHGGEHALEVQLPFLQVVLGDSLRIIPVVMGEQSRDAVRSLAEAIVHAARGEHILVVASSDLSHYHTDSHAREVDKRVVEKVREFDPDGLWEEVRQGVAEACGAGPMVAAMLAARQLGASRAEVLRYATSADSVYGDRETVVGYLAAVFVRGKAENGRVDGEVGAEEKTPVAGPGEVRFDEGVSAGELTDERRAELLRIAREHVKAAAKGKPAPAVEVEDEVLNRRCGAFVTLREPGGELRGCIGYPEAWRPLAQTVAEVAEAAATRDPRFPPVAPREVGKLAVEVSVLSPMAPIDPEEVEPGRHGVVIRHRGRQGLLLPQVATNQGWDREQFLDHLCLKAALSPGAWRDPEAKLYAFTAEVFSDDETAS
ncbi:MAG TPA: AmmeMemoRadiSam system protein B [Bacteroidetes bacterium]|nr:AmmeMemoRadiSam system protein B [Bacteroidota bacterium]